MTSGRARSAASGSEQGGALPFLKWLGGKRWLAPVVSALIKPELNGVYYEPFVGAGAVLLELQPSRAVISDLNDSLIQCLKVVAREPEAVVRRVWKLTNTPECYYRVRASRPRSDVGAAARFIYLNRTCWGGVYRVNRRGEFNVPFGDNARVVCRKQDVIRASVALRRATLRCCDFEDSIACAGRGDAVYADPPYYASNGHFRHYTKPLFTEEDHSRLARAAHAACRRGAFLAISGPADKSFLQRYAGWYYYEFARMSCVARDSAARGCRREVLVLRRAPSEHVTPRRSPKGLRRIGGDLTV